MDINYKSPPESAYSLWYYPQWNRFTDEDGFLIHDFTNLFDVWQIEQWKRTKDYGLLIDRYGNFCELYYMQPDVCDHDCDICKSKCEIYYGLKDWKTEHLYY